MAYRSFEELEVWQRACRRAVEIFRVFDDCKSVPDFKRFLSIALGSNAELRTQLYIARRIGVID